MTTKLYQIKEDDLALLESELPRLLEASFSTCNDAIVRKRWESVKSIVSNIRWDYGPPQDVRKVEHFGEQD